MYGGWMKDGHGLINSSFIRLKKPQKHQSVCLKCLEDTSSCKNVPPMTLAKQSYLSLLSSISQSAPLSTVFGTWSRNSGAARCQVIQFWRPELLLTDKSSPVEASRPPASSNPSPLIKQTSALPDFLSLHPTSPVITPCCIYLANLTAGPLSRWSHVLTNSVKQESKEGGEVQFSQHLPEGAATSASLVRWILPGVMQSLETGFFFSW